MKTDYIIDILSHILQSVGRKVNRRDVAAALFSDYSFPSMASIVNTLKYFGIRGEAYEIDEEYLYTTDKMPVVHTNLFGGHFYIVKSLTAERITLYDGIYRKVTLDYFRKIWDNKVIFIEHNCTPSAKHNFYKEHLSTQFTMTLATLMAVILMSIQLKTVFNIWNVVINFAGIILSFILLKDKILTFSRLPLCNIGKNINCKTAIQLNTFDKYPLLSLPAIGLLFFVFDLVFSLCVHHNSIVSKLITFVALLIMLFLSAYQIFKLRRYCLYCLSVFALIVVKTIVITTFPTIPGVHYKALIIAFCLSLICCLLVIKFLIQEKRIFEEEVEALRLKRNPYVFSSLMMKNESVNVDTQNSLVWGNPDAKTEITIIVDLHCKYCKRIICQMRHMIQEFPDRYSWKLMINGKSTSDMIEKEYVSKNKEIYGLYHLYSKHADDVLAYICMGRHYNPAKFEHEIPDLNPYQQQKHITGLMLTSFPIVLINGRLLPKEYQLKDLKYLF